jgi:hypothetical protein
MCLSRVALHLVAAQLKGWLCGTFLKPSERPMRRLFITSVQKQPNLEAFMQVALGHGLVCNFVEEYILKTSDFNPNFFSGRE